jgi:hypothetical protein
MGGDNSRILGSVFVDNHGAAVWRAVVYKDYLDVL